MAILGASLLACGGASEADAPSASEDALGARTQEIGAGAWTRKTTNGYRVAVEVEAPERPGEAVAYDLSLSKDTVAIPSFSQTLNRVAQRKDNGSYEDELSPSCTLTLRAHFRSIQVEQRGSCEQTFGLRAGERIDISGTYVAREGIGD